MSNSEYVLEAVNLTKTFPGVKALDQVSLRVRPGTVHAPVSYTHLQTGKRFQYRRHHAAVKWNQGTSIAGTGIQK